MATEKVDSGWLSRKFVVSIALCIAATVALFMLPKVAFWEWVIGVGTICSVWMGNQTIQNGQHLKANGGS